MSKVSRRTGSGSGDPTERLQSWAAALVTALLHGLLVLLVMLAPPITVPPPQEGGAAGSSLQVTYIDATLRPTSQAAVRPPPRRAPGLMWRGSVLSGAGTGIPPCGWQPVAAVLVIVFVPGLLVLRGVLARPITVTPPQEGGAAGSRLQVTYIDETLRPPSPAPVPPPRPEPPRKRPAPAPPANRVQTTPVEQADDSTALQVVDIPATSPEPASAPPDVPEEAVQRPAHTWGQPPGMLPEDLAPVNAGPARRRGTNREIGRAH